MDVGRLSVIIISMRKTFVNVEFYHVYNRGTDKRFVFMDNYDFKRFLQSMEEFNSVEPIGSIYQNSFIKSQLRRPTSKLVNIICYCLNQNHYHMIIQQYADNGVSEFMRKLNGGYTKYFNWKHKRNGVLFQGKFKAIHIDSNEYLLHASAYVNLNNRVHRLKNEHFFSSWNEFMKNENKSICKKNVILSQFKSKVEYSNFAIEALQNILNKKDLQKELEILLSLEN